MNSPPNSFRLVTALRRPDQLNGLGLAQWDVLIRQARRAGVLAKLVSAVKQAGVFSSLPPPVRAHLDSADVYAKKQNQVVQWELRCLRQALGEIGVDVILLKGAAYLAAELPCGDGRIFSDIDILVPKSRLRDVERVMLQHGWITNKTDPYDQRYYRQWMHEIPPLTHVKRGTVLDVHHTILPETARFNPPAEKLFDGVTEVSGRPGIKVLADTDMVLHSAAHLFFEGEFEHGLRDLADLDCLLNYFGKNADFWSRLVQRADELDLLLALVYTFRYTREIFETPIPTPIFDQVAHRAGGVLKRKWMDMLFMRALAPAHETTQDAFSGVARWLLYVRGHYLRMPMRLLIPHLVRKATRPKPAQ